jgi:hypothetical protein
MKYSYACVSTDGQSVDDQVGQLTGAGRNKVLPEVARGARPTAPGLVGCSASSGQVMC